MLFKLKCTTVLAGIFALSQTLWTIQAIPVTSLQPIDNSVSVRDNGVSQVNNVQVYRTKRAPGDPDMSTIMHTNENNLLKTWSGWIEEPANSGWNANTIARFARSAYDYITAELNEPWILAALWIQGEGVAFGSQVRGNSFQDKTAEQRLAALLPAHAPVLWQHIEFREVVKKKEGYPKWHAEDVAMWKAAKEMARKNRPIAGATYPANIMSIYGRYTEDFTERHVPPCQTATNANFGRMIPGCMQILQDLGITVFRP